MKKCLHSKCDNNLPEGSHGQRKFCSDECKLDNYYLIRKKHTHCVTKDCGKELSKGAGKYCSRACRYKSFYHSKRVNRPAKIMLDAARQRAKKQNVPCTITEQDITTPEYCPILGLKLEHQIDNNCKAEYNSPSLDKIVPSKGYTKDNIRVISNRANWLKCDATFEETEALYNDYKQLREDFGI